MATTNQLNGNHPFSIPLFNQVPGALEAMKQRLAALQQEERFIQSVLAHEGVPSLTMMPQTKAESKPKTEPVVQPMVAKSTPPKGDAVGQFQINRRQAMEAFFQAGGHLTMSNRDIGKKFHASKSLVSLYLSEAVKKGLALPRQGVNGRAVKG